jgi:hypothetical protein
MRLLINERMTTIAIYVWLLIVLGNFVYPFIEYRVNLIRYFFYSDSFIYSESFWRLLSEQVEINFFFVIGFLIITILLKLWFWVWDGFTSNE